MTAALVSLTRRAVSDGRPAALIAGCARSGRGAARGKCVRCLLHGNRHIVRLADAGQRFADTTRGAPEKGDETPLIHCGARNAGCGILRYFIEHRGDDRA